MYKALPFVLGNVKFKYKFKFNLTGVFKKCIS